MCGIVAATADRDVVPILLAGLQALEYRGYDSAGFSVLDAEGSLRRLRTEGKVTRLMSMQDEAGLGGCLALDMGLGKTPTVLAHISASDSDGPALVVAPLIVGLVASFSN